MPINETLTSAEHTQALETAEKIVSQFSWHKVLYTLVLIVCCLVVMKVVMTILNRAITRLKLEKSLNGFIRSSVKVLMWAITVVIVLGYIGVPVTSLVAVLSVVGVAVSLAIQGTLSNLAGGIMLLASKPFKVGDYIEVVTGDGTSAGTVADIGMVYSTLKSVDNKLLYIPNGQISTARITNFTSEEIRRVEIKLSLSYDAPRAAVVDAIQEVLGRHPKTLFTPPPFVRVSGYLDSAVEYTVRVWCATEDYWEVYFDLLEQIKDAFDRRNVELTYPHVNVHIIEK